MIIFSRIERKFPAIVCMLLAFVGGCLMFHTSFLSHCDFANISQHRRDVPIELVVVVNLIGDRASRDLGGFVSRAQAYVQ